MEKKDPKAIKLFILEDRPVILEGIRQWILSEPDYQIIHSTGSWEEMGVIIQAHQQGILVSTVRCLKPVFNEVMKIKSIRVVCLCDEGLGINPGNVFDSNICGIMNQTADRHEFLHGLHNVTEGRFYISTKISQDDNSSSLLDSNNINESEVILSRREKEVLSLISLGFSDKEIGELLHLSKRTVDGYRNNLLIKFGARNSAHLIRFAIVHNLILPDEMLKASLQV